MATKVRLGDGEEVMLETNDPNEFESFFRIGRGLIIGISKLHSEKSSVLYIFKGINDVYLYLGDLVLIDQEDNAIEWGVTVASPRQEDFIKRMKDTFSQFATEFLVMKGELGYRPNHVELLSRANP